MLSINLIKLRISMISLSCVLLNMYTYIDTYVLSSVGLIEQIASVININIYTSIHQISNNIYITFGSNCIKSHYFLQFISKFFLYFSNIKHFFMLQLTAIYDTVTFDVSGGHVYLCCRRK